MCIQAGIFRVNFSAAYAETKDVCPVYPLGKMAGFGTAMMRSGARNFTESMAIWTMAAWLAAGGLAFSGSGLQGQDKNTHRVELVEVQQRRLETVLNSFGSLEPFRNIEVSAMGQGRIVSMPVQEGGWVKKGEPLVEIDRRADEIALKRAEAELRKSELELEKLEAGSRPEEIEESKRRLAASEAVMKATEDEWERVQKLADQGIAATSELVRARSEFDVSVAQYSQAKARLALIEEGARNEEVLVAEAEVTIRNVMVEDIRRRMKDLTVTAPFEGVVARRMKEVGEWAIPGDMALEMMVMNPMKLRIAVPQKHVAVIRPGQRAKVSIPGLEDADLNGTVLAVIPSASEGSRNFPVVLEMDNSKRRLAAGMYANVSLVLDNGRDVRVIPRTAVQYRDQQMVVYRFRAGKEESDGAVEEIAVEIGQ